MKCDDELYNWLLYWRDVMQKKHDKQLTYPDPLEETIFSEFVREVNEELARVDQPDQP